MKTRWFALIGVLLLIVLAALGCRKTESDNTAGTMTDTSSTDTSATTVTTGTSDTTGTGSTGGTISSLSDNDKEFVMKAADGGMAEVSLGNMAAQKATNADVKAFGNRMATDHSKAGDELKALATNKGLALPTSLGAENQKTMDELSKKSGKDFDKAYMDDMVKDHEKDVKEFEKASNEAQDPDLKSWAAKTLPTLQDHLKMAKATRAKLK